MGNYINALNCLKNGTYICAYLSCDDVLEGVIDTFYETNNEFDPDNPLYREYSVCLLKVIKTKGSLSKYKEGMLVELTPDDHYYLITLANGSVIWNEDMETEMGSKLEL